MIIGLTKEKRPSKANVRCDDCRHSEIVSADYERRRAGDWEVKDGPVKARLIAHGWSITNRHMTCPKCVAKQKASKPTQTENVPMTAQIIAADGLRKPSREDRRNIMDMLQACYDTATERYNGGETDKTVAEAIGGHILPGWVAEIREEFFGPDGGNAEMDEVVDAIRRLEGRAAIIDSKIAEIQRTSATEIEWMRKQHKEITGEITAAKAAIDRIRAAVGPKAGAR